MESATDKARKDDIAEVINLYYHIVDTYDANRMAEIFSDDCVIDLSEFGAPLRVGIDKIIESFSGTGPRMVLAHMGTNMRIELVGEEARCVTKCIALLEGGKTSVAIHSDKLRHTAKGWRVYERKMTMPAPLKASLG